MPKRKAPAAESGNGSASSNGDAGIENSNEGFLVVGIGASAGGITALKTFFENVPADSGMAYVVILHLSPDHDSRLAEVLQVASRIPVTQGTEKERLQPDHVYVVPPNKSLGMQDGHVTVAPLRSVEERRAPVDIFFRKLAETHGERAVGVVLSGTGANGSMGIKRIKENGGVAFVQNPREAEFNEMPRNSIATDLVDAILPVSEIPARIKAYKDGLGRVQIPLQMMDREDVQQQALREIFTQLRVRTGHDFSNYKRATVMRRIERRIGVRTMPDLPAYSDYLKENPEEAQSLLKDLLISVTNFYRDGKSWDLLEREIIPRILEGKKPGEAVRVWSVGCATGEEAYSLAMLFAEQAQSTGEPKPVQIFATDIDEHAISAARDGFYTLNDAADVSADRLRQFFVKENDSFRIRREIREMVLFANHNVLKDPPFSNLDLVLCRNLLIYFNGIAQERVFETLHFALKPGGFLFIGSSESIDGSGDLFAAVDKENHIFQSREVTSRPFPVPESVPLVKFHAPDDGSKSKAGRALERITYNDLHQRLLEQYAPPSLVVNEEYEIVHLSSKVGKYLHVAGGEPSNNLLKLIHPDLRLEMRTALYQAVQRSTNVEARGLKMALDGRIETVNVLVRPVLDPNDTARGFFLIIFEESIDDDAPVETLDTSPEPMAKQLEEELVRSKSQLKSSLEHAEVQTEELRASNEELQAMNEELRSSAEELETSKEELQSINEELVTVNQELKIKIEELSQSNNNFQNLINSTNIATIFLDRGLRVNVFSPASNSIFNLLLTDIGRPLSDITNRLAYDDLITDAEAVLENLQPIERELRTSEGDVFLMRVHPYRTAEDLISGVVLTFIDITRLKRAEDDLREQADELARFNNAMIGREERMIDLKKEINELCRRLGEPERYPLDFEK